MILATRHCAAELRFTIDSAIEQYNRVQ